MSEDPTTALPKIVLRELEEVLDELDALLKSNALGDALSDRGVNISLALTAAAGLRAYLRGDKANAIADLGTAAEEIAARVSERALSGSGGSAGRLSCTALSPTAQYLVETLVTLVAVVAVSVFVLWTARRLGVGAPQGPLALVGRLPLDQKRAIYLVRVGEQVLVVGASEGGLVKLGELSRDEVPEPAPPPTFREVLARVRGGAKDDARDDVPPETEAETREPT